MIGVVTLVPEIGEWKRVLQLLLACYVAVLREGPTGCLCLCRVTLPGFRSGLAQHPLATAHVDSNETNNPEGASHPSAHPCARSFALVHGGWHRVQAGLTGQFGPASIGLQRARLAGDRGV
jgi:hypothetical protein